MKDISSITLGQWATCFAVNVGSESMRVFYILFQVTGFQNLWSHGMAFPWLALYHPLLYVPNCDVHVVL